MQAGETAETYHTYRVGFHTSAPGPGVYPGVGIFNSPRSPARAQDEGSGFRPALWPPEDSSKSPTSPVLVSSHNSAAARTGAEATLLKWQFELGDLEPKGECDLSDCRGREMPVHGLHRVDHSQEDDCESSEEGESADPLGSTPINTDSDESPETSTLKTTTTISKVVDFIGQRIQEVHTEMKAPGKYLSEARCGRDDPDLVSPIVRGCDMSDPLGNTSPARSNLSCTHDGSQNTRQIVPKANCSFLFARVVSCHDADVSPGPNNTSLNSQSAERESPDSIDQNAVAEWWSNLIQFKPSAPSRQAQLIRSTHEKLEQMLIRKDERIDKLYAQAFAFERSFQAAEIFSHFIVNELENVGSDLRALHDASRDHLTSSGRASDTLRAMHAQELANLRTHLEDAHTMKIAGIQARLQEEIRSKEEALRRVAHFQEEGAQWREENGKNSNRARELRAETEKMRVLLEQKDGQLRLQQAKEAELAQQQHKQIELLQQQKETELRLLAAEHLSSLRAKDAELLERVQALSKAKMDEIEAAKSELRAEMRKKEEEYEALREKKDSELEALDKKHKTELDALSKDMSQKADDLLVQVRAGVSTNEELQRQLDETRENMSKELNEKQEALREARRGLEDAKTEMDRMKAELEREKERRKNAEGNSEELCSGLEQKIRELERRLEVSERDSAGEIARLRAEIERLKAELEAERSKRRELESKLRLAEEALRRAKLVGIGMRITDHVPHQITEIIEGGAAHLSGALQVGDYLVEVAQMDVSEHSIADIRNFILGPAGSYLDLKIDRRDENDEPHLFSIKIKRSELVAMGDHMQNKALQPTVFSTASRPASISASPPGASEAVAPPGASRGSKKKRAGYVPGPFF